MILITVVEQYCILILRIIEYISYKFIKDTFDIWNTKFMTIMSHSWIHLCIYGLGYESLHWKYNTKIGVMRIAIHLTRRWSFLKVKLWVSIFIIALNYNLTTTRCCTFYLVVACHLVYITYNLNVFLTIINCKRYENKTMFNQHVTILTLY